MRDLAEKTNWLNERFGGDVEIKSVLRTRNTEFGMVNQPLQKVTCQLQGSRFEHCVFEDVVFWNCNISDATFDRCAFRSCRFWGCSFLNCTFPNTVLTDTSLSMLGSTGDTATKFLNCTFSMTDFRGVAAIANIFKSCLFQESKVKGVNFGSSCFERCVFSTDLSYVEFYSHSDPEVTSITNFLLECDLRESKIYETMFVNINLRLDMLPKSSDLLAFEKGPNDLKSWKEAHAGADRALIRYIDYLIPHCGTPCVLERHLLKPFSKSDVDSLCSYGRNLGFGS